MALRRRKRDQRGAAAVEFALILPIFLMVLFGVIDFGYAINRSAVVNNAARDAARVATFAEATPAEVTTAVQRALDGMPGVTVTFDCRPALPTDPACTFNDRMSGNYAAVTVRYQHTMITPVGMFFPGGIDLSRTSEMRVE